MVKLILLLLLFLLSLLVVFRAPLNLLWYVAILVTEFSWIFVLLVLVVLLLPSAHGRLQPVYLIAAFITILLLLHPYWQAWRLGQRLQVEFKEVFEESLVRSTEDPFSLLDIFSGIGAPKVEYRRLLYDTTHRLSVHFYPAQKSGKRPCVIVIHGGSWSGGDNRQLPELNSKLARDGYHVAAINYRLAPAFHFPAPVEDVQTALNFLQQHAKDLAIDSTSFVLLGRSAGGQIALSAAYTLREPAIKGVIDFYGPADMVWGYKNPTNPFVLDSKAVLENYLGGKFSQVPGQYIRSSATETVTRHTPPTLMIYAGIDPLVSPRHGDLLSAELVKAGSPYYLLLLPWATHAFDYTLTGPGGQLSTWAVQRFLEAVLTER